MIPGARVRLGDESCSLRHRGARGIGRKGAIRRASPRRDPPLSTADPSAEIKPPAATEPPRVGHAFTREEAAGFIRAASQNPDDVDLLFYLFAGVRPEELAGLGWQHVTFDESSGCGVARIERVVLKRRGGGFEFAPPKTEDGRRSVYFPAHVCRALCEQRERRAARAAEFTKQVSVRVWPRRGRAFRGALKDRSRRPSATNRHTQKLPRHVSDRQHTYLLKPLKYCGVISKRPGGGDCFL
jgi:integrase